jgi:hypothetical protein
MNNEKKTAKKKRKGARGARARSTAEGGCAPGRAEVFRYEDKGKREEKRGWRT